MKNYIKSVLIPISLVLIAINSSCGSRYCDKSEVKISNVVKEGDYSCLYIDDASPHGSMYQGMDGIIDDENADQIFIKVYRKKYFYIPAKDLKQEYYPLGVRGFELPVKIYNPNNKTIIIH